jgi:hypothetical protein
MSGTTHVYELSSLVTELRSNDASSLGINVVCLTGDEAESTKMEL